MFSKSIATAFLLANALVILFVHTEAVGGNNFKIFQLSPTEQSTAFLSVGKEASGEEDRRYSKPLKIKVGHSNLFCGHIECYCMSGGMKVLPVDRPKSDFTFNPRCGINIAILNKGRTVQRISESDVLNAVAFTNRPLKVNEIFEVRLDKKLAKYGSSLGIGITTSNPNVVNIISKIWTLPDVKIYYNDKIYSHGKSILQNYGRNLNNLMVGDRVGVMRNEFGTLHFFFNGVDLGPAASNVPSTVYGLLDLYGDGARATIVDTMSATYS